MADYRVFRMDYAGPEKFGRVARMTLEVPGAVPRRYWAMVECFRSGVVMTHGSHLRLPLDYRTRAEVEIELQRQGTTVVDIHPL